MAGLSFSFSKSLKCLAVICSFTLLSACSTLVGYHAQTASAVQLLQQGRPLEGVAVLDQDRKGESDQDLLYWFEKGELLRQGGQHSASATTWRQAEKWLDGWEDRAKLQASDLLREASAFLLNDTTRTYEGRDYEKSLLNLRLAMAYVAQGEWENARVAIRRMHEREGVIAALREKEIDAAKKEAQEKGGMLGSFRELNGYPVETLESPAVLALKNSYESAIANYFAGFVYEALKEPSLAAAGYRRAIELSGKKLPMLDQSLAGLDSRVKQGTGSQTDLLLILETGQAPTVISRDFALPVPVNTGRGRYRGPSLVWVPMSWPVIPPQPPSLIPKTLRIDSQSLPLLSLTQVDAMARRALRDEMPKILLRTSVRAATKAALQVAGQDRNNGNAGALLGFFAAVGGMLTEHADERLWRTLPDVFSIARVTVPAGEHVLQFDTPSGPVSHPLQLKPGYAVLDLRLSDRASYLSLSPSFGGESVNLSGSPKNEAADQPLSQPESIIRQPAVRKRPVRRLSDEQKSLKEKP